MRAMLAYQCEAQMLIAIKGITQPVKFRTLEEAHLWCFEHRHVTVRQIAPFLSKEESDALWALVEKQQVWENCDDDSKMPERVFGTIYDLPVWEADGRNATLYHTKARLPFFMELNAINIMCAMCEFKSLPIRTTLEVQF